jgi:hypothetical protein|tara:strand:- start:371 stop:685 length:315 start_codon:yes stop_codon:yes gene_type:complete
MIKGAAYFFLGFLAGLVIVELTDGKPAKKVNYYKHDYYRVRYIYEPYPFTRTYYRTDTFNNQRPYNNTGGYNANNGESKSNNNTNSNTFNHTAQERQDSWGTKN